MREVGVARPGEGDGAAEVRLYHAPPGVRVRLDEPPARPLARVQDERIEVSPPVRDDALHRRGRRGVVVQVETDWEYLFGGVRGELLGVVTSGPVRAAHPAAALCQGCGDGGSDAAGPAGDQRDAGGVVIVLVHSQECTDRSKNSPGCS